jgi:hypothetical protein
MPRSTYFVQECPTCGRNLQVRVEYLGKQVECQHCHARFSAFEPGSAEYCESESGLSLLERAEQLLQSSGVSVPASTAFTSDLAPVHPK